MAAAETALQPAMETVPQTMTMEEYLHTSFRPDCDFVNGQIEERNMGDTPHSILQGEVAYWFRLRRDEWNIRSLPELRTRVSSDKIRIPDVQVAFNDAAMAERVRLTAPLIAVEVLSPEDRLPRVLVRLEDFWKMGIRHVWLLDPVERVAFTYTTAGLKRVEGTRLEVEGTPIYLDLVEVFAGLD